MKNLTGIASSFPAQRSFETGDDLDEANFDTAFQSAADRAQWLKATVDDMLATGIKKLRIAAGSASLKALTGMVTGDVALISPVSTSTFGLYVFQAGSLLGSDIEGWAYNASDSSGCWIRDIGFLMALGGAGGSTPQLRQDRLAVPNRIVAVNTLAENSPDFRDTVATGALVWDETGLSISTSVALQVGDIVLVEAGASITNVTSNQFANMRIASVNPSSVVAGIVGSQRRASIPTAGLQFPMHCAGTFVASAAGFHDFKVQVEGPSGNTIRLSTDRFLRAMIIRPLSGSEEHPVGVPFLRGPDLLLRNKLVKPFLPGPVGAGKDPLFHLCSGTLFVELAVNRVDALKYLFVGLHRLCRVVYVHKDLDLLGRRNRAPRDEPEAVFPCAAGQMSIALVAYRGEESSFFEQGAGAGEAAPASSLHEKSTCVGLCL